VILGGDDTFKSEKTCKFTDDLSAIFFYSIENWVTIGGVFRGIIASISNSDLGAILRFVVIVLLVPKTGITVFLSRINNGINCQK
jgi:hypothetical protein